MILQFILLVLSFLSFFPWIPIFRIGSRFLFNLDLDSGKKFNPNPEKNPDQRHCIIPVLWIRKKLFRIRILPILFKIFGNYSMFYLKNDNALKINDVSKNAVLWIRNDIFQIRLWIFRVPDPCRSGSNPRYLSIFGNCKQYHLKFNHKEKPMNYLPFSISYYSPTVQVQNSKRNNFLFICSFMFCWI